MVEDRRELRLETEFQSMIDGTSTAPAENLIAEQDNGTTGSQLRFRGGGRRMPRDEKINENRHRVDKNHSTDRATQEAELNRQKEASARRHRILKYIESKGSASIDEILAVLHQQFDDSITRDSAKRDIRELEQLLDGKRLYRRDDGGLGFYVDESVAAQQKDEELTDKNEIGEFVVEHVLKDAEVAYLSTGTTVYASARSLVKVIKSGKAPKLRVVLTDNLLVIELFLRETHHRSRLAGIGFYVLGGKALWADGDIGLEGNLAQLGQWGYSAAVISATAVHPKTGHVYSYRQQETKLHLLKNVAVGTVVIPVTKTKVDNNKVAGKLVLDPKGMRDDITYMVVSKDLSSDVITQLEQHGYIVHDVAHQSSAPKLPGLET